MKFALKLDRRRKTPKRLVKADCPKCATLKNCCSIGVEASGLCCPTVIYPSAVKFHTDIGLTADNSDNDASLAEDVADNNDATDASAAADEIRLLLLEQSGWLANRHW